MSSYLCPAHAWAVQAAEDAPWRDGLGTSLIYHDLARQALALLADYAPAQPAARTAGLRRWLTRWRRRFWPPAPAATLAGQLTAQEVCPVCDSGCRAAQRLTHTLLAGYRTGEVRVAFAQSDGLCLNHLRRALAQAQPEAAAFLVETATAKLRALIADLAEYQRKHAWHVRDEPKFEREQHAWVRAVAFFAGEAAKPEPEAVYQRRRRALEIFQAERQRRASVEGGDQR